MTAAARPDLRRGQRGYYCLPEAARVLADRVAALVAHCPIGSSVLDLGCNDGRIGAALLACGRARTVVGIDLEDLRHESRPDFTFLYADLTTVTLPSLPEADVALCLNVLHHVVWRAGSVRAKGLLQHLLDTAAVVFVDMGSHTERGGWGWRRVYARSWPDDERMWSELFGDVKREAILHYPAHGGGARTLWKLWGRG